jgi:ACS family pantothenate transporter-like MFS transporter
VNRYWYMFVVLWILAGETESFSSNALLQLYMKSHPGKKYSVSQVNNYPTGVPAVGIVSTLFFATLTDFMGGKRYIGKELRLLWKLVANGVQLDTG